LDYITVRDASGRFYTNYLEKNASGGGRRIAKSCFCCLWANQCSSNTISVASTNKFCTSYNMQCDWFRRCYFQY